MSDAFARSIAAPYGGGYRLAGTAKRQPTSGEPVPVRRPVRAVHMATGRDWLTWSDVETGAWEISNVFPGRYLVVLHDSEREHNAAVADFVTAVPMSFA